MNYANSIFTLFFVVFPFALTGEVPSYVHLCNRNASPVDLGKCMTNTVFEMKPHLIEGIPEMNVPAIDPIYVKNVVANTGDSTVIGINAELSEIYLYGAKNIEFDEFTADIKNYDNIRFSGKMKFPEIQFKSNYKMKGNILIVSLDSTGTLEANLTAVLLSGEWYGKVEARNGKDYVKFDRIDMDVKSKDIKVELTNLFANNKEVNDATNKLINENMDVILPEVFPVINNVISSIAIEIFTNVFDLFSIDELFPQ